MNANPSAMVLRRFLTACLFFVALAFVGTGCVAPRYVNAKTRLEAAYPSNQRTRDSVWQLVAEENLIPSDQARADALRQGAFDYFAEQEKDSDIFPAGATSGNVGANLLAVSQRTNNATFPTPTELSFQLSNVTVGQEGSAAGFLVVRFGEANSANAVEYRSDTPGGRLAFEIFQIYRDRAGRAASGKFSAILRNRRDPNDRTALYIMDGSFITGVRN